MKKEEKIIEILQCCGLNVVTTEITIKKVTVYKMKVVVAKRKNTRGPKYDFGGQAWQDETEFHLGLLGVSFTGFIDGKKGLLILEAPKRKLNKILLSNIDKQE